MIFCEAIPQRSTTASKSGFCKTLAAQVYRPVSIAQKCPNIARRYILFFQKNTFRRQIVNKAEGGGQSTGPWLWVGALGRQLPETTAEMAQLQLIEKVPKYGIVMFAFHQHLGFRQSNKGDVDEFYSYTNKKLLPKSCVLVFGLEQVRMAVSMHSRSVSK